MAVTDVYLSTSNLPTSVRLNLLNLSHSPDARLLLDKVGDNEGSKKVLTIPRRLDNYDAYHLDLSLRLAGIVYVASLQVLLKGHGGLGSMIWWRWRTAAESIGRWESDTQSYATHVRAGELSLQFIVQGVSNPPSYDDINLTLRRT